MKIPCPSIRIPGLPWLAAVLSIAIPLPAVAGPRDGSATFADDLAFLARHTKVEVLADPDTGAKVAVAPAWQGRVMTSTCGGSGDPSYGWLGYAAIEAGIRPAAEREGLQRHIHVFGGEERFWLGPEGGQFALFFPPGAPYEFARWQVPALFDTEPFEVVARGPRSLRFARDAELANRAGTTFTLRIERELELLPAAAATAALGLADVPAGAVAAYRSTNLLINRGAAAWTREGGLPSIWLLGMFKHGPAVTVVVPRRAGVPGDPVRADYFGMPGEDRLRVTERAVFFKADGAFRSKLGIPAAAASGLAGAWDAGRGVLTLVRCETPAGAAALPYVRSQWQDHADPYDGEQIHLYNDGPPEPGAAPLGPFFEIETSSPALALAPGDSARHVSVTAHFSGPRERLDVIARAAFGLGLAEIEAVFAAAP
jgi:hypothetical protein